MWWRAVLKRRELMALVVHPDRIYCSRLRPHRSRRLTELISYRVAELPAGAIGATCIYNLSLISKIVRSFAGRDARRMSLVVALSDAVATQKIVAYPHTHPELQAGLSLGTNECQWQHCYLYPDNKGKFVFYACGISRGISLQWQLIAQMAGMPLEILVGDRMSALALYQALYGGAFRQSQLAVHMARTEQAIEKLFTTDTLARFLFVPRTVAVDRATALQPLLTTCGLTLLGSQDEEA